MTDPIAATFVRSVRPGSNEWFGPAKDRLRIDSADSEAFVKFRASLAEGRGLTLATLSAKCETTVSGTMPVRSVVPGNVKPLTWNTRPANYSGSADRAATISGKNLSWDVTADYNAARAAGEEFIEFKFSQSSTTAQFLTTASLELTLTTYALAVTPTDVGPAGVVGTLKPEFKWTAPQGISQVQVQIDEAGGDWSTLVYDSGALSSTVPKVDTATQGPVWAGLSGAMQARVRHFTTAGGWSNYATVSLSYTALTNFVVSNPGASDADPTPPSSWTPSAAAVRIVSYLDGDEIHDTDMVQGPLTTLTPAKGANKAGQVLKRVYEFYDSTQRTQPAFVTRTTTTTYTPSAGVAGLTTFTAAQATGLPAVDSTWTRSGGLPDEVALAQGEREGEIPAGGLGAYRDWTVQPNTTMTYSARAVVNGQRSNAVQNQTIRTKVEAVWLVDPLTERGFVLSGLDGIDIAMGGETVVHTPIDGAELLRRTLTLRGPEGSIRGRIANYWPGRTQLTQKLDADWLRQQPRRTLRLILGDLNVPVVCSSLYPLFNRELFFADAPEWDVYFSFSHAGGF